MSFGIGEINSFSYERYSSEFGDEFRDTKLVVG